MDQEVQIWTWTLSLYALAGRYDCCLLAFHLNKAAVIIK
jgi:hypothetical protein